MKIPCDHKDVCLPQTFQGGDLTSPGSFSTEALDRDHAFCYSSYHNIVDPGPGRNWTTLECGGYSSYFGPLTCEQNTVDDCETCLVLNQRTVGDPPQSVVVDSGCNSMSSFFCNTEQNCSLTCPDGSVFTYTVPAGKFCEDNQMLADQEAYSYACLMARQEMLCINNPSGSYCVGQNVYAPIILTGPNAPFALVQIAGTLPPGVSMVGNTLVGTVTTAGQYYFDIVATDPAGNMAIRLVIIFVTEILTDSLADGVVGTSYSQFVLVNGGSGRYLWSVISGSLPPGLALDPNNGTISGTPTTGGTYDFEIGVQTI